MAVGNPVTDLSTTGNFVPVTRTLTINGVSYDLSADRSWSIASPGGGSVTSVAMTVPTGFSVTGSPITSAGTLAVSFASGYALPTTVKQSNWDDAYTFVSNFPSQTGNNGKFLYTSGSVLSWQPALQNPMTAVGDMIYGGVSGAVTVLTGNQSAVRQYLQQVGTGSASTAPVWGGIVSTDISGQALTRVNDANVTLTLTGTPGNSVLNAVEITAGWAGTLTAARGGTGTGGVTGIMLGNSTAPVTGVTGIGGQILRANPSTGVYEFWTPTYLESPFTAAGQIIYSGAGGQPLALNANSTANNMYLKSVSSGTPSWASIAGGDIVGAALTSSNDTNVQITLGGTPSNSVLRSVSLTMGWTGQLAVARGGTGVATITGVVIGNGTANMSAVVGTAGQFLRRNTANTAYEFRTLQGGDIAGSELTKTDDTNVTLSLGGTPASSLLQPVSLTLGWTGQLSVSRGGTGASTLTGVLIGNGTSAVTAITGTAGQLLRRNAANTAYEFFTASLITGNGVADRVAKWTSATNLVDSQIIDNGTNVGIGVSPSYKLDVNGTIRSTGANPAFRSDNTIDYTSLVSYKNGTRVFQIDTVGTNFQLYHQASASYVLNIAGTSGYVGIGTDTPSTKLEVSSTLEILRLKGTGTGQNWIGFRNDTTNLGFIGYGSSSNNGLSIYNYQNDILQLGTNGTMRLYIEGGGNIGIGTNSPNSKLHTLGSFTAQDNIYLQRSSGSLYLPVMNFWNGTGSPLAGTKGDILAIGNTGGDAMVFVTNAAERVRINSSGSVGIGINAPASTLDVYGSINIRDSYYLTFGGAYGADIPTISGVSGSGSNGFLQFYPAGSTSGVKMALRRTGQLALTSYTSSSAFTGTAVATLAVTSAGDLITIAPSQTTASGTYTPTWSGLANVDSVTAFSCQYMRVGDTVTVSGWVTINATADNTPTSLSFSLPINSNTSTVNYLNGTGVAEGGGPAACLSGYGSNFGEFEVIPTLAAAVNYSFIFTYRII